MTKLVSTARGALGSLLLGAALATTGTLAWSVPAQAAQQVSKEFFEKFEPAQAAMQKRDYATALRAAKESVGAAKNATEKGYALKVQLGAAYQLKDWGDAAAAADALIGMDSISGAEKNTYRRTLATVYAQQRQPDKAIAYAQEAMKGGATQADYELLFSMYQLKGDCPNQLAMLDKILAGKPANEPQLKARNACYFKAKDESKRAPVVEELVRRFPKKAYFTDLIGVYGDQKLDDRAMLNVYRWGFDKDLIEREADYVAYANAALSGGSSIEAHRALEKGVKSGAVSTKDATSRVARLVDSTKKISADDKAKIPQLDKEARAGKNGETDVSVGAAYFGTGEYAKAAEALQRAMQPERVGRVKRPDDANMLLGIALTKSGKKADAEKAFTAAKADPRMAKAAALWLGK
jgi:tetratricopeptide (TPR) repeat protein